ncbi:MAG TPA: MbcA/ParS/Xre antitoxin family protein [Steroidobacter sp.]
MSKLQHQSAELARLIELARAVLEDDDKAADWFTNSQCGLGGQRPIDLACNEADAREIENLLLRIEHSVYS